MTACSGRPDRYIVWSRSKTPRQFSTSSVFDSFRPNADAPCRGRGAEAPEHRDRVRVLQVVPERGVGDRHVGEPEVVVDDAAHLLGAQQRRVALHRGVQAALLDQVERDPLDLVGRAAVHRRERDRVGEAGGNLEIANRRVVAGDDLHVRRQVGRRVGHGVEVPLHVRLEHPLEVVADAHVEDHAGPPAWNPSFW